MKLSTDDPRITAYALGEIDEAGERQAIEAAIAKSPELQQMIREIRETEDLLRAGFQAEPSPELSEFDKARMEQPKARKGIPDGLSYKRLLSWPGLTALAGAAAVALLVFVLVPPYSEQALESYPKPIDLVAVPGIPEPPPPEEKAEAELRIEAAPLTDSDTLLLNGTVMAMDMIEVPDEEAFELAQFEVGTSNDRGYLSTNAISGVRMMTASTYSAGVPSAAVPVMNTESYDVIEESGFRSPLVAPLSTFSIDVDTASYANVRRFLGQGQLPPADAVRIEELINYFPYADAPPTQSLEAGGDPFAVHIAQTVAPWSTDNRILRIAIKGYEMPWEERPPSNLVFLLDVSGSMNDANKLPLVKQSLDLLVRRLDERDRVAIVVYAGASGLVLPSTTANNQKTIVHAINNLAAGGSTNGGAGIQLAYKVARENFIEDGNNRVILCTDGDFNVGQTNRGSLADTASAQAENGVSLTILGFGMGNYKDGMLEELSNKGKGSYAYIDSREEARKVFQQDLVSNLFKIAKDVKIQVEFNPAQVQAYRLIGYENRRLKAEDFNNDQVKAGDIGPGHSVVALYEIVPAGGDVELSTVDPLRYQSQPEPKSTSAELATVKLRYKRPEGNESKLIEQAVLSDDWIPLEGASDDLRFSVAVAAFGMLLSSSEHIDGFTYQEVGETAASAIGVDPGGYRAEFTDLVRQAELLGDQPNP